MMPQPLPARSVIASQTSPPTQPASKSSSEPEAEVELEDGSPPPPGTTTAYKRKRKEIRRAMIAMGAFLLIYVVFGKESEWVFLKALAFEAPDKIEIGLHLPLLVLCMLLAHLAGIMADGIRLARTLGGGLGVSFLPKGDIDASLTTTKEKPDRLPKKMWGRILYLVARFGDRFLTMAVFFAVILMGFTIAIEALAKTVMQPPLPAWAAATFLGMAALRLTQFTLLQLRCWREDKKIMEALQILVGSVIMLTMGLIILAAIASVIMVIWVAIWG